MTKSLFPEVAPPQIKLNLGTVVQDANGEDWVFIGYAESTRSTLLVFARPTWRVGFGMVRSYYAAEKETILNRFPSLRKQVL